MMMFLFGCNNDDKKITAEGAHDAAGMFINNVLDGKFDEAGKLMVQDSENNHWLHETEKKYINLSREDKRNMRESEPTIYETRKVSDTVSIIYYSNSYNNRKDSVKLVRKSGNWLVDLKYTFPVADIPKNVE
jgi:hypothetical protein